jgi:hypothetical protein
MADLLNNWFTRWWDFIDSRQIVRRIAFFVLLAMTWNSFTWAMEFVSTTTKSGAEVGLMVAAVTVPIGYLQKAIVELYNEARK